MSDWPDFVDRIIALQQVVNLLIRFVPRAHREEVAKKLAESPVLAAEFIEAISHGDSFLNDVAVYQEHK